ncbi:MAG TPA: hypothetical protein VGJ47_01770 [Gemmatimonadaceae bacterium]|jgi:hypothetical protein
MLGKPDLATRIDDAVTALNTESPASAAVHSFLVSARLSLANASDVVGDVPPTEGDMLAAIIEVTLDRLAQIADSTSGHRTATTHPARVKRGRGVTR